MSQSENLDDIPEELRNFKIHNYLNNSWLDYGGNSMCEIERQYAITAASNNVRLEWPTIEWQNDSILQPVCHPFYDFLSPQLKECAKIEVFMKLRLQSENHILIISNNIIYWNWCKNQRTTHRITEKLIPELLEWTDWILIDSNTPIDLNLLRIFFNANKRIFWLFNPFGDENISQMKGLLTDFHCITTCKYLPEFFPRRDAFLLGIQKSCIEEKCDSVVFEEELSNCHQEYESLIKYNTNFDYLPEYAKRILIQYADSHFTMESATILSR